MSERHELQALFHRFQHGEIDRRTFVRGAAAAGMSAGAITMALRNSSAAAQDATPATPGASPAGSMSAMKSITRQEYLQQLQEHFDLGEPGSQGGQIFEGLTSDINTTNPLLAGDIYSGRITGLVYEWLTETSAIDGQQVPGLADYWELADDGVTYTFHLNPDATWHDGEPVTAEDVVFSFDAMLGEESLSRSSATVRSAIASYEALDDHTVRLTGAAPSATFLESTTLLVAIMPRHIWADIPLGEWGGDPGSTGTDPSRVIGSGPFVFREWVTGDHITIARNPDWRESEPMPVIDEYTIRVLPEQTTAVQSLVTGEIDFYSIPSSEIANIEQDPNITLHVYPSNSFSLYSANQDESHTPLFVDARVRQALMHALDRELIIESIYFGYGEVATGTQPPLSIAYAPDRMRTVYDFDPERARQLLDEAGWVEGEDGIREKDGVRFSFEALFVESSIAYSQQLPYMQQVWRDVGIDMIPTAVPFGVMNDATQPGNFEMAFYAFFWGFDGSQGDMFRCNAVPLEGFNSMRYCNPEFDDLDRQAQQELDQDRRVELLIEATNIVNDDAAAGVMLFGESFIGARSRVHNFIPNGYSFLWSMPYVWMDALE